MDAYSLGILLRGLLASAGLKATVAIVFIGGLLYCIYKVATSLGSFLERLIQNRDQMLSQTLERIAQQDTKRAEHEVRLAEVLARIEVTAAAQLNEAQVTRTEVHARLNKMQESITKIEGAVS